jgi:hypothetical protein
MPERGECAPSDNTRRGASSEPRHQQSQRLMRISHTPEGTIANINALISRLGDQFEADRSKANDIAAAATAKASWDAAEQALAPGDSPRRGERWASHAGALV